jgi:hypothetical protein
MAGSTLIGGMEQASVERMLLDSSQFEKGIQDCAKLIRQQQRHEKDLELVRAELEKRTQGLAETNANLTDAVAGVGKSFTIATLAAKGLEVGLRAAHGAMSDLIRRGLEWEEDVKGNEAGIDRMRAAMGGLSDSLVVAAERERMMKSGLQATEEQLDAVGKAAVVYSRQMNVDVDQALATITERLIGGRGVPRLMRELGIEFTTTGDKAVDAIKAMGEMESKFGSMAITAENTKEALAQASSSWSDFTGALGAWLIKATGAKEVMQDIAGLLKRNTPGGSGAGSEGFDTSPNSLGGFVAHVVGDAQKRAAKLETQGSAYDSMFSGGRKMGWIPKYDADADAKASGKRPELTFAEKRLLQEYEQQIERERKLNEAAVKLTEARDRAAKDQREFSIWVSEAQARTLRRQVEETNERQAQGRDRWKERKDLLGGSASFLLGADGMRNLDAMISRMDRLNSTMEPGTQLMRELNQAAKGFSSTLRELGTGTLVQAYGGILNIADAAIQGKGNLGEMALELGKSTALGLSQTLLAQGLAASIQASAYAAVPFTWPLAAAYSTQAGIFYGGAATLGAIGLGLSAGQAALSGRSSASPSGGSSATTGESYRPSYGQREEQQPITIENVVYVGGKADLGAVPWQRAIIQSQVKQRN